MFRVFIVSVYWKIHDDPWTEHAAYDPMCTFVQAHMTKEFVESAVLRRSALLEDQTTLFVADVLKKRVDNNVVAETIRSLGGNVSSSSELYERAVSITRKTCLVCMDKTADIVFRPCNHLATCEECSVKVASCPVCRAVTYTKLRIFIC